MEQIIFIASSKNDINRFLIGGAKNYNKLKSTFDKKNEWNCVYITFTTSYKQFEQRFWSVIEKYRDKNDRSIINMGYEETLNIFKKINSNMNKELKYTNYILSKKNNNNNCIPIIPNPIDINEI